MRSQKNCKCLICRLCDWLRSFELVLEGSVHSPLIDLYYSFVGRKERCQKQWLHRKRFVRGAYVEKISRCALADVTKQPNNIPRNETCRNQVLLLQITNRGNTDIVSYLCLSWDNWVLHSNSACDSKTSLFTSPRRLARSNAQRNISIALQKVFGMFMYNRVQCAMNLFHRIQV